MVPSRSLLDSPLRGLAMLLLFGVGTAVGAAQAPAARAKRPNILVVIADDWSNGHAGVFGTRWIRTPAFDRVAREGVLFTNCFTSNPKCSPCRASFLTGRNSWQTEEAVCHNGIFPGKWPVYPDLLEQAGYHVGFTGKGWGPGDFLAGGFKRNPAGPAFNRLRLRPPYPGIGPNDYAGNFGEFLKARKPDQPFCFWLGGQEPHRPYSEGVGLRAGKRLADVELPSYYPKSDVIRSDFLDYAVEVEWFDTQLGRALTELEKAGELDNTLVMVTSDHGCPFPRVKGQIYEQGFHLPLAIRWGSSVRPGRKVEDFIGVRDFAPTFLEAARVPIPASVTGKSFLSALRSERTGWLDPARNRALVGKERHDLGRPHDWGYPVRALRTPEYLYVHNYFPGRWPVGNPETSYPNCDNGPTKTLITFQFDESYRLCFGKRPEEELYRVSEDPDCVRNLALDPAGRARCRELRREMETLLREDRDPRVLGDGAIFDTYRYLGPRLHAFDAWERAHTAPGSSRPLPPSSGAGGDRG